MKNNSLNIGEVEDVLGYCFKDPNLLIRALTRKAYALEQKQIGLACDDQKIFATLGDAILKAVLIELLIRHGYENPGDITIKKSELEERSNLGSLPLALAISPFMRVGCGEQGVQNQPDHVGETFEAVIAAIYQDGGHGIVKQLVFGWFEQLI